MKLLYALTSAYKHTRTEALTGAHSHMHSLTHTHPTRTDTCALTHTHTYTLNTLTRRNAQAHTQSHTCTHTQSVSHTHLHLHTHTHCVPCLPQGFPWSLFGSSPRRLHTTHGPVSGIRNTLAPKDELYYCCRRMGVSSQEMGTHTFLYGEPRNPGIPPSSVRGGMGTCPFL